MGGNDAAESASGPERQSPPAAAVGDPGARAAGRRPGGFDRIRPVHAESPRRADPQGKQALFSSPEPEPTWGHAAVTCPACQRRTVVSLATLAKLTFPGVYAPWPRSGHKVWARCPECGRREWLRVQFGS